MTKAKHALCVTILLMTAACERLDTMENVYPDAPSAISAGAVERGWIPAFLPPSAKEINEKHNLDTNEVWLRFSMDPGERDSIEKSCQRIEAAKAAFPRKGGGDWWPDLLTEKQRGAQQQADEYTHYRCGNGGSIAIERDGRKVFYWHHEGVKGVKGVKVKGDVVD